ncbi:MAG: ankyrin repeat protein [Oleispira sp.]|jgi:ankyrin repeat protein
MSLPRRNLGFEILLDALRRESPEKVTNIVKSDVSLLKQTNSIGENALTWCALELMYDQVELLRSLGSPIQEQALSEAIQHGNSDMVNLLLELGGNISEYSAEQSIRIAKGFDSGDRILHIMKSHLSAYGINV